MLPPKKEEISFAPIFPPLVNTVQTRSIRHSFVCKSWRKKGCQGAEITCKVDFSSLLLLIRDYKREESLQLEEWKKKPERVLTYLKPKYFFCYVSYLRTLYVLTMNFDNALRKDVCDQKIMKMSSEQRRPHFYVNHEDWKLLCQTCEYLLTFLA